MELEFKQYKVNINIDNLAVLKDAPYYKEYGYVPQKKYEDWIHMLHSINFITIIEEKEYTILATKYKYYGTNIIVVDAVFKYINDHIRVNINTKNNPEFNSLFN